MKNVKNVKFCKLLKGRLKDSKLRKLDTNFLVCVKLD